MALLASVLLVAVGCRGPDEQPETQATAAAAVLPGARGAAIEVPTSRDLEEIARL